MAEYYERRDEGIYDWQSEAEIPIFILKIDDEQTRRQAAERLVDRTALTITRRLPLQPPSGVLSLLIDLQSAAANGQVDEKVFWDLVRQELIRSAEKGGILKRNWRRLNPKNIPPTLYGTEKLNSLNLSRVPCDTLRQLAKRAGLERIELIVPQLELMEPLPAAALLGRFKGDWMDHEWNTEKGPPCLIKAATPSDYSMPFLGEGPDQVYLHTGQARFFNLPPPKSPK